MMRPLACVVALAVVLLASALPLAACASDPTPAPTKTVNGADLRQKGCC